MYVRCAQAKKSPSLKIQKILTSLESRMKTKEIFNFEENHFCIFEVKFDKGLFSLKGFSSLL